VSATAFAAPVPAAGDLDPVLRAILVAGGPTNAIGALIFAPPWPWARDWFGLPAGHELYLWILSIWILLFGIAYSAMGLAGRVDRTFLWVGAGGKATFSLALIAMAMAGKIPAIAAIIGLPDLMLAAVFVRWLLR
jgi:hypothetical protein